MLGLTLLASFYAAGRGLGASGAFSLAAGVGMDAVAPDYAGSLKYFSRYLDQPQPLLDWGLFLIIGVFLGRVNRWANIIAGTLFVLAQIGSLFAGAPSPMYIFYSIIEIAGLLLIVWYAWKWRNPEAQS